MQKSDIINLLVDFASQIEFSKHQYIQKNSAGFSLTEKKTKPSDLIDLINAISSQKASLSFSELKQFHTATQVIETHLIQKISGFFSWFIGKQEKGRIEGLIKEIREKSHIRKLPVSESLSEGEARLKFYEQLPRRLKVKDAAANDLIVIKEVSQKIWNASESDEKYQEHMTMFFEGEHLLFEEDEKDPLSDHFEFYEHLKNPAIGSYLRGSSHYDHGTTNYKTGGPVPTEKDIHEGKINNPQYEIEGPQVKALLFGRVKLALDQDSKPIRGKTFDEVTQGRKEKEAESPTKFRKYTFMQTEWAPDSDSFFNANYWKHRILSFCLYAWRKTFGFEKPNVGPYGYGHNDPKATIIPFKKS